jgi:3-methyladenine DNA glycosylase Tag
MDWKMKEYQWLHNQVIKRFRSKRDMEASLPVPRSRAQLIAMVDSSYLSEMSRRVFRAGLKHSLVDAKWPAFEKAFFNFNLRRVSMMSDDELDTLMGNTSIIRHWNKIKSVRHNAVFLGEMVHLHGSVGQWLANWPQEDVVGLWLLLRKQAVQMGGNSAPSFLRMVGKDTFLLTEDVVVALMAQGVVDKKPTSKADLRKVQSAFNDWQQQSGRPFCQLSRMLAMTVNY